VKQSLFRVASALALATLLAQAGRAEASNWHGFRKAGFDKGIDAAVNWGDGKVYFFRGPNYIRFDVAADRVDPGYPRPIAGNWAGFDTAGFDKGIDAAVNLGDGKVYFFRGDEYIRFDIGDDRVDPGYPAKIAANWHGMRKAGFDRGIDSIVKWDNGKAYIFRGDEYVRYDITNDRVDPGYPVKITANWRGFEAAGFDRSVRAALDWGNGKVYFFRGSRYIRFDMAGDTVDPGYPASITR
jgi:hypothetical protein